MGAQASAGELSLPAEARPLLLAAAATTHRGFLEQREVLQRVAAFAAAGAETRLPAAELAELAHAEGLRLKLGALLRAAYAVDPDASAGRLVADALAAREEDLLDALWAAATVEVPWPHFGEDLQPSLGLSELRTALEERFICERSGLLDWLRKRAPDLAESDGDALLMGLRATLGAGRFWQGFRLAQAGLFTGFDEAEGQAAGLPDDQLLPVLKAHFLACLDSADASEEAALRLQDAFQAVTLRPSGPNAWAEPTVTADDNRSELGGDMTAGCLRVEVMSVENVTAPTARLGDVVIGTVRGVGEAIFASGRQPDPAEANMNAYVEVEFAGARRRTRQTPVPCGGRADFSELFHFPLGSGGDPSAALVVRVFDARPSMRTQLIGDPLVGRVCWRVPLGAEPELHRLPLDQRDLARLEPASRTVVVLRSWVVAASAASDVLNRSPQHSFQEVALALSQLLASPHGLEQLLAARPGVLRQVSEEALRETLGRWIGRLCAQASELHRRKEVSMQASHMARGALEVVAACAPEADGEAVLSLTAEWAQGVFQRCGAGGEAVNEAALLRLLESGRSQLLDRASLSAYGLRAPEGLSDVQVDALLKRIREAEASEEQEVFTGDLVVEHGQARDGLAAVLRGSGTSSLHVFLYDQASIERWLQERGEDPLTRERLGRECLVPLGRP